MALAMTDVNPIHLQIILAMKNLQYRHLLTDLPIATIEPIRIPILSATMIGRVSEHLPMACP